MFIYNLKVNGNGIFKAILIVIGIIILVLFGIAFFKIFNQSMKVKDGLTKADISNLSSENYTNVLKTVTDNLDDYIGEKIRFTGYVYRAMDFTNEEFVIARDMLINPQNETLIVGFLCKYKDAQNFKDKVWVEITGTITKGMYHSEIPVIDIKEMKQVDKPQDPLVYPPDEYYIPTSVLF